MLRCAESGVSEPAVDARGQCICSPGKAAGRTRGTLAITLRKSPRVRFAYPGYNGRRGYDVLAATTRDVRLKRADSVRRKPSTPSPFPATLSIA